MAPCHGVDLSLSSKGHCGTRGELGQRERERQTFDRRVQKKLPRQEEEEVKMAALASILSRKHSKIPEVGQEGMDS